MGVRVSPGARWGFQPLGNADDPNLLLRFPANAAIVLVGVGLVPLAAQHGWGVSAGAVASSFSLELLKVTLNGCGLLPPSFEFLSRSLDLTVESGTFGSISLG